jgi:pimeloyl-ACP methyl ester carboxylesterase
VRDLAEATASLGRLARAGDVVLFENDLPDTYADTSATALQSPTPGPPTNGLAGVAAPSGQPRELLELDGLRLAFRASGTSRAGTPVVLLHGWGASLDAMAAIQNSFESQHPTVAFDLPGFGQSDPPPGAWGSADYAALIERALAELELERVSLIGHSFGGKVALQLAVRRPRLVERLVLVNSAGIRPRRSLDYRARVAGFKLARRALAPLGLADWLARRTGSADFRAAGALRTTLVRSVNEDLRPLLPRVQAPTLIVWGDQDQETPPADAAIMEREIPDAGLVMLAGAGHFSYADDLPRFCRVVGYFLGSLSAS